MYKSKSIDFEFFETDEKVQFHESKEEHECSKIITTAIIETNPLTEVDLPRSSKLSTIPFKENEVDSSRSYSTRNEQLQNDSCFTSLSSSTSSIERRLLEELSLDDSSGNCWAYNSDLCENREVISSLGENECSETSLSDSTFTTITSDFTSVSPLSYTSQSCHVYDEHDVLSKPPNKGDYNENSIDENTEIIQVQVDILKNEECRQEESYDKHTDSNSDFDDCYDILGMDSGDGKDNGPRPKQNCGYNNILGGASDISESKEELGNISIDSHSSPLLRTFKTPLCRGLNKLRLKKREQCNLTFRREELIKIERDNLILLKKIMAYSKPRTLSLNQSFGTKKTTAAINRAKQQKKIEQDNYILYNKISALGRMKKVF